MIYDFSPVMHYNKTGTSLKTFTGSDLSNILLGWSGQDAPTGVTISLYSNETITYQYGTGTSVTDANTRTLFATIDVKDLAQMQTIGQNMISMTQAFRPIEITTITATNNQNITYRELDQLSQSRWFYPVNLVNVNSVNTITFDNLSETVTCIVTGRTLEITPDNWTTTYQLWKGFDY